MRMLTMLSGPSGRIYGFFIVTTKLVPDMPLVEIVELAW
jgi:hypothetical protein